MSESNEVRRTQAKMEPALEVDPTRLLIIVGPQFTVSVLSELSSPSDSPTFDYGSAFEEGVRMLSDSESCRGDAERQKQEMLYRNAYELDPIFALRKVTESLKKLARYEEWLNRLFARDLPAGEQTSESLQHLIELQRVGALLVYTHCDDTLSQVSNTQPVHLDNPELVEQWSTGRTPGFLHVHGVYTKPSTVRLDGGLYDHSASYLTHPAAGVLKRALAQRCTVVIGFDSHTTDPLQAMFLEGFIAKNGKQRAYALDRNVPHCLPVMMECPSECKVICAMSDTSSSLWKQMEFPIEESDEAQILGLLVAEKQGATEISKKLFNAPGVNFALMNSVLYQGQRVHTVSIRVDSTRFHNLWQWLLEVEGPSLLNNGLLAVAVVHSGMFVWLRGKPLTGGRSPTPDNTEFMDILTSGRQPADAAEVTMEITSSQANTNSSVRAILSTHSPKAQSAASTVGMAPPSPVTNLQDVARPRIVPRYTVKFKRFKLAPHEIGSRLSSLLEHQPSNSALRFTDDSSVLMTSNGSPIPRSVLSRRSSLPPMRPSFKPLPVLEDDSNALTKLAGSLQNASGVDETPSYVAIKQALLCDMYKRRQSVQTDPKTLKHLLQAKLVISEKKELDLISQRRRSDPGLYVKQRDFVRRKELFVDENTNWSKSYGSVIEYKIASWQRKRQARQRFEMFRKRLKGGGVSYQVVGNQPPPLINPLHSELTSSAPVTVATGTPQASFVQPTSYLPGVAPFVYPQAVCPPPTAPATTASAMYSSFVTPYSFVNPYSTLMTNGQPMTYLVPQNTLLTAGAVPQKVVYFMPSATMSPPAGIVTTAPTPVSSTMPQLAKLMAPTSACTAAVATPPMISTHTLPRHHDHPEGGSILANLVSPTSRKRYSSLPEKLASLLQPVDRQNGSNSPSPPPTKKHRSSEPTVCYSHRTPSPKSSSVIECQLLRSQLQNRHPINGFNRVIETQELQEILGGLPHAPGVSQRDGQAHQSQSHLQLWQFLLELLLISANSHLIQWTDNAAFEFQINKPGDVAQLWGRCSSNSTMNYEKLARGIRYYYTCGIMSKVSGQHLTFRYSGNVTSYIHMRQSQVNMGGDVVVVE